MKKILLSAAVVALLSCGAYADVCLDSYDTVVETTGSMSGDWAVTADPDGFYNGCLKCVYDYTGDPTRGGNGYIDWNYWNADYTGNPLDLTDVSGFSFKLKVPVASSDFTILMMLEDKGGNAMRIYPHPAPFNITPDTWTDVLLPLAQSLSDAPAGDFTAGLQNSVWMMNSQAIDLKGIVKIGFKICDRTAITTDGNLTFYVDEFYGLERPEDLNETAIWDANDFADQAALENALAPITAATTLELVTEDDGSKAVKLNFTYQKWGSMGLQFKEELSTPLDFSNIAYLKAYATGSTASYTDVVNPRVNFTLIDSVDYANRSVCPYYSWGMTNTDGWITEFIPFTTALQSENSTGRWQYYACCNAWSTTLTNLADIKQVRFSYNANNPGTFATSYKVKKLVYGNTAATPTSPHSAVADWSVF